MAAEPDRRLPVEPERPLAQLVLRHDPLGAALPAPRRAEVVPELEARVDRPVAVVDLDVHPVAAHDPAVRVLALGEPRARRLVGARADPDAVVLEPAVDVVRGGVVDLDGVELADGRGVQLRPRRAAVVAHVEAAVVPRDHVARARGVEPQRVVVDVDVRPVGAPPPRPAVGGAHERDAQDVEPLVVVGRHADLAEVVAVAVEQVVERVLVRPRPRPPVVVGAVDLGADDGRVEQLGVGVFEEGHEVGRRDPPRPDHLEDRLGGVAVGDVVGVEEGVEVVLGEREEVLGRDLAEEVAGHDRRVVVGLLGPPRLVVDDGEERPARVGVEADPPDGVAGREAGALDVQARERPAAVVGAPEPRARPALAEVPRPARARPRRGVDARRVGRVEEDVDGARVVVEAEHALPRPAAVVGPVDAALSVRRVQVADGGHERHVRVVAVDDHAPDVVRLVEPEVRPRLAAVGRLVDAGAGVGRPRRVRLAGADPDGRPVALGVAPVDGDVADRDLGHVVEERREGAAGVRRPPQAARGVGDVEVGRVARLALDVGHAPAHDRRPDGPERDLGDGGPAGEVGADLGRPRPLGGRRRRDRVHGHHAAGRRAHGVGVLGRRGRGGDRRGGEEGERGEARGGRGGQHRGGAVAGSGVWKHTVRPARGRAGGP